MKSGELIAAYVFGSVGRGQQDELSDLDLLAIVKNGGGKVHEEVVASHIPRDLQCLKLSISWYGANRLREMFRNGELFAWHLYRETLPLYDPTHFLTNLGQPTPYDGCVKDVMSFKKVLSGIPLQLAINEGNAVYEAGLVYVCLRNISMAASWLLCEVPDFSRYSCFNLKIAAPCPVSLWEFEKTMHCRMSGQRGGDPPPNVDSGFVLALFERLTPWLDELLLALHRRVLHGCYH